MKTKERLGIGWIIVSFIFVQPLGVLLLGIRLGQNRKDMIKGSGTMLKLSVTFIALFLLFLISDNITTEDIYYSIYFFGAGGVLGFVISLLMRKRGTVDEKYKSVVEGHRLTKVEHIAQAMKLSEEIVMRDLQKMIKCGIFPDAELDRAAGIFCLDKDVPEEKRKTFSCDGCGATVVAIVGKDSVCEYCGSPVNG